MGDPWEKAARAGVGSPSPLGAFSNTGWLASQFCFSVALLLVEVAASRTTGSLLLLSCSFHTLGGALGLGVALVEVWVGAGGCPLGRNTFGWARVRVTGTLVSAVLLSSFCLALIPEAVHRVAAPQVTEHALALMGIGAVGIPVHLARAGLPGSERHRRDPGMQPCCFCSKRAAHAGSSAQEAEGLLANGPSANEPFWAEGDRDAAPTSAAAEKPGPWQALCLGWVVACLGPVAVLLYSVTFHLLWTPCLGPAACSDHCLRSPCRAWSASSTLPWREEGPCWLLYLDPGLAVVVAAALLAWALPALRSSALVLLQAIPEGLNLQGLEWRLRATEGVAALQELRVWQLDGPGSLVATAHVRCLEATSCEAVMERVRQVFCEHGIHTATVQPDLGAHPANHCDRRGYPGAPRQGCCRARGLAVITEYETTV